MGTNYYLAKNKPTCANALHIGKSSGGWRFLFSYHDKYDIDWKMIGETHLNSFEKWKEYLEKSVESGEYSIVNEYDEIVSVDDFIKLVQSKQSIDNPEQFDYCDNVNGYRFSGRIFC